MVDVQSQAFQKDEMHSMIVAVPFSFDALLYASKEEYMVDCT